MMWRALIILATHVCVVLLAWSGFCWITEGEGLNPLIAFPAAAIMYFWMWLWIVDDAASNEQRIEDYLEWLDEQEKNLMIMKDMPEHYDSSTVKGGLIEVLKQRDHWA